MAFGSDPLGDLPAMQLRTGQGGPRVAEILTGGIQLVLKLGPVASKVLNLFNL